MNKLEKGWLENYLKFRQDLLKQNADKLKGKSAHPEHSLYRILQPTGLMYGYSFSEETEKLDEKDKMIARSYTQKNQ
ncbi:MAG: hypothetical protein LW821_12100 [Flammeovirgaceae bacterium]|nr:hypothetical protein [Flammeovirgaceae bacterium]